MKRFFFGFIAGMVLSTVMSTRAQTVQIKPAKMNCVLDAGVIHEIADAVYSRFVPSPR